MFKPTINQSVRIALWAIAFSLIFVLGTIAALVSGAFAETHVEATQRAIEDFSERNQCPRSQVERVFPQEYQCQCSRDTSCHKFRVIQGCAGKDVYVIGVNPIGFRKAMTHRPYILPPNPPVIF